MMCISSCCSILYRNIAIYIIYQVFIPLIGLLLMMQCIRSGYFEHKTARGVFCEEMCLFHIASGLYLNSLNFSRNFLCLFLSKKTRYALVYFSGIANEWSKFKLILTFLKFWPSHNVISYILTGLFMTIFVVKKSFSGLFQRCFGAVWNLFYYSIGSQYITFSSLLKINKGPIKIEI